MDIKGHLVILNPRAHYKTGALAELVNDLDGTVFAQLPSLPGVGGTLKQLLRIFGGKQRPLKSLVFSVNYEDGRLPDRQLQLLCSIGMKHVN